MKATGTGAVIGIALETFAPESPNDPYYSDTFINQYADDIPVTEDKDAILEALTEKTLETATLGQSASLTESQDSVLPGASPEEEREVQTGQIIMFVDLSYRYLDDTTTNALATLMSTPGQSATLTESEDSVLPGAGQEETLFARLTTLAKSFVDGVLSVFQLDAERAQVTEVCVDENTCIDETKLLELLEQVGRSASTSSTTVPQAEESEEVGEEVVPTVPTTTDATNASSSPASASSTEAVDETVIATSSAPVSEEVVPVPVVEPPVSPETNSTPAETAPEPPTPPAPTPVVEASEVTNNEET
jgi:hypothetical protein